MMKYLLLLILFVIVWWAWKKRSTPPRDDARRNPPVERMVTCAHCGVHLPESDALADGARYFCNDAHRRAVQRQGS